LEGFAITLSTLLLVISALAAAFSAYFAQRSVKSIWMASQAQLVSTLLDSWASKDMLDACIELTAWKKDHGESFAEDFKRLRCGEYDSVRLIDHARRLISHHFQKVYTLGKERLLEKRLVLNVVDEWQANLYCTIVEPLEAAVRPDYDKSSFVYFAAMYGIKRTVSLS
jgi:hypothetical protein